MVQRVTRSESREQTHQRLLDAAAVVFAKRGYHGASVDEVAEEAGVSKGAVYYHFKSKDELLLALADERGGSMLRAVHEIFARPVPLQDKLVALAATVGSRAREHAVLDLEFWPHAVRDTEVRGPVVGGLNLLKASIERLIQEEAKRSELALPMPAGDVASAVLALGIGMMVQHALQPGSMRPELFAAAVGQLLGAGVAPALRA